MQTTFVEGLKKKNKNTKPINMKKLNTLFIAFAVLATFACKKKDDTTTPPADNTGAVELSGDLTTQSLDASRKYLLKGQVFVRTGQTLTIPAGTIIMGDKATKAALIIDRGGKINAVGTATSPIIFTSAQAVGARDEGDWSGVILLGNAKVNASSPTIEGITPAVTFGGTDDADNSGVMKYCRIEFAGIALTPNNETNSLTFGGVGNGTTIEYIQSSFGGDDAFEWFGGSVNCKHLVSYADWDDNFDTDNGFSGKVQFGIAIRDPFQADQSGSNGFESDNDANGSANLPQTSAVFSNITIVGPKSDSAVAISGNYNQAAHIRRNSAISIFNSFLVGYNKGLLIDAQTTYNNFTANTGKLGYNIMASALNGTAAPAFYGVAGTGITFTATDVQTLFEASGSKYTIATSPSKVANWSPVGLSEAIFVAENTSGYPANPNLAVTSGPAASGANFTDAKLSGFENVTFRGAIGTSDWTDGWANFDPKNVVY